MKTKQSPLSPAPTAVGHDVIAKHKLGDRRRSGVRDPMERSSADLSPDPDNALKDDVDKELDAFAEPRQQRSATSL